MCIGAKGKGAIYNILTFEWIGRQCTKFKQKTKQNIFRNHKGKIINVPSQSKEASQSKRYMGKAKLVDVVCHLHLSFICYRSGTLKLKVVS